MELVTVQFEDQPVQVWAHRAKNKLWLHYRGKSVCVSDSLSDERDHSVGEDASSGEMFAPMPGKILKVNVKKGDSVMAGQVLVVMEAMKMEYSMSAYGAGVIIELNCKVGDQVTKDALLVKVKL